MNQQSLNTILAGVILYLVIGIDISSIGVVYAETQFVRSEEKSPSESGRYHPFGKYSDLKNSKGFFRGSVQFGIPPGSEYTPVPQGVSLGGSARIPEPAERTSEYLSMMRSVGLLHPIDCTAWLTDSGYGITAGHCCCSERICTGSEQWKQCRGLIGSRLYFPYEPMPQKGIGARTVDAETPTKFYSYTIEDVIGLDFDGESCNKIGNDWAVFRIEEDNGKTALEDQRSLYNDEKIGLKVASLNQIYMLPELKDKTILSFGFGQTRDDDDSALPKRKEGNGVLVATDIVNDTLKYTTGTGWGGGSGSPLLAKTSDGDWVVVGVHTDYIKYRCVPKIGPVNAGTFFTNEAFRKAATKAN
jgi:hypothetical protein